METSNLEDLLKGNFMFTGSTMFRRGLFGELPDWFYTAQTGDWALHICNAQYGMIGYLNEVMAVYRIHADNWWSSRTSAARLIEQIKLLDQINTYLGFKYQRQIKATQYGASATLAEMLYQQGDLSGANTFLTRCVKLGLSNYRMPTAHQMKRLVKLRNPALFSLLKSLRNLVYSQRS
jgi:hypothetical protein